MHEVIITKTPKAKYPGEPVKTRQFTATLHSYIEADALWSGGQAKTDKVRPVWARFVGTEQQLRAFAANLREGRTIEQYRSSGYSSRIEKRYEFLRGAGYVYTWQRNDHGSVLTLTIPELFSMDPGMIDPATAQFVLLTPRWYTEQYGEQAQAQRFLTYLRNRTRRPIITTSAFATFLLDRAIAEHIAVPRDNAQSVRCVAHGNLDDVMPPLFVNVTQLRLDEFLANAVQAWFGSESERIAA